MNYLYTINPAAEEPVMLINRHIGYDKNEREPEGIQGHQFEQELLTLDGMSKKRIKVYINSSGGSVMDGMSIYNAIRKSRTQVDTYCTGIAASIAAVIFEAGHNRIMADYAKLMYHNPYIPDGGADDSLNVIKDSLIKMVTSRNSKGRTAADISAAMDKTTWMNAQEAIDAGFADTVESTDGLSNPKVAAFTDARALWSEANMILNQLFYTPKKTSMLKVINKLQLNADANEDSILHAISKMESDIADARNKAAGAVAQLTEEKARNLVTGFARAGKIKNDEATIAKWVNKAKEDFDGVKDMLETLPVSKAAAKIEIGAANSLDTLRTSQAAVTMAAIRNRINAIV